jgi:dienelactone hydrolase
LLYSYSAIVPIVVVVIVRCITTTTTSKLKLNATTTMVQLDFSLKEQFSWHDYCASSTTDGWDKLHESSRQFMETLNLTAIHPHCITQDFASDAPLMGPLLNHDYHERDWDAVVTTWHQASPALLAMGELWLRLFSALLAPLGIAYLLWTLLGPSEVKDVKREKSRKFRIAIVSMFSLASSVVLATDMWYVYQYGPNYGVSLLLASALLSAVCATRHKLKFVGIFLILTLFLTLKLSFNTGAFQFGGDDLPHSVPEGLYYNDDNALINRLVQHWPSKTRTYSVENGATPWTPTGDSRTGIPFLVNDALPWPDLDLTKVWVETVDDEAVRLEIAFPPGGHRADKAMYVILHGLTGGSQEEFIKDHTHRATAQGHTVAIMIARGLMDTPIKGWNVFHGARITDIDAAAKAIRPALGPGQSLVGAGYSMGAIILANYVARSGKDCALDAAIAVSGVLDCRFQFFNERAKRLWQPMLAITLRDQFVVGKVGDRYRERLTRKQMMELMRATHISVSS